MSDQKESRTQDINIMSKAQFQALCDAQLKSYMKSEILPRTILLMREAKKYQQQIDEVLNELKKFDHLVGLLERYHEKFMYKYGFLPKPPSKTVGINVDFSFPEQDLQEETDVKPDLLDQPVFSGLFVSQGNDSDKSSALLSKGSANKLNNKQDEQGAIGIKNNIVTNSGDTQVKQIKPEETYTNDSSVNADVKSGNTPLLCHQQNKLASDPVATTAVTTVQSGTASNASQAFVLYIPKPETPKNMPNVKLMLNPASRQALPQKLPIPLPKPVKKPATITSNASHRQKQMSKKVQMRTTASDISLPQRIKNLLPSNAMVGIVSKVVTPGESIAKIVKLPGSASAISGVVSAPTEKQQNVLPKSIVGTRGRAHLGYSPDSSYPSISIQKLCPFPEKSTKSPSVLDPPPKPVLKVSNVYKGILVHWRLTLTPFHDRIKLFQVCVKDTDCKEEKWKIVGVINALPVKGKYKACTLSEFVRGQRYSFALRAVDVCFRKGPLSNKVSLTIMRLEYNTSG